MKLQLVRQDEPIGAVARDGNHVSDRADRKRAVNVGVLLAAGLGCLVANRGGHPVAIDDEYDEIVSIAVQELRDGAELVTERAMNEALVVERDTAGRDPVLAGGHGVQPGGPLGYVKQLRHSCTP